MVHFHGLCYNVTQEKQEEGGEEALLQKSGIETLLASTDVDGHQG